MQIGLIGSKESMNDESHEALETLPELAFLSYRILTAKSSDPLTAFFSNAPGLLRARSFQIMMALMETFESANELAYLEIIGSFRISSVV